MWQQYYNAFRSLSSSRLKGWRSGQLRLVQAYACFSGMASAVALVRGSGARLHVRGLCEELPFMGSPSILGATCCNSCLLPSHDRPAGLGLDVLASCDCHQEG